MKFSDLISTSNPRTSTSKLNESQKKYNNFSCPSVVDLESGQKFWRLNLDTYLSHFMPTIEEPDHPNNKNNNNNDDNGGFMITVPKQSAGGSRYGEIKVEDDEDHFKKKKKKKKKKSSKKGGGLLLPAAAVRKRSPNCYYSEMNAEEREENIKSLISYCKNSST
ncbi:hypothetical protein M9H77_23934 [Catharanthus roseus]|uniref:Uncharacterized protein n=1 Tax=Catharanthus roseus TaxID=4058 RepID=A0ACC0AVI5_CATRO|nr:hypothetical protein M9H77_23934 [Catharanthus roseus]